MSTDKQQLLLADKWNLYYHLSFDKNWDANSYKLIMNIQTLQELILINESMPNELIKTCMLFVMKNGIMPLWEDPANRNGGAFSYKVDIKHVAVVWNRLFYMLCGGCLMKNIAHYSLVNGISISPKRGFCIIKIWLKDCSLQDPTSVVAIPELIKEGCLFKKHEPEF